METKNIFNISFLNEQAGNNLLRTGQIQIGNFTEQFECSLEFWRIEDYELHWFQSIRRVIESRMDSCLISSITNPKFASFLFWWPIYVIDDASVVIQNQILFLDECSIDFDPSFPHKSLRPREVLSAEGETISEWAVSLKALEIWFSSHVCNADKFSA